MDKSGVPYAHNTSLLKPMFVPVAKLVYVLIAEIKTGKKLWLNWK